MKFKITFLTIFAFGIFCFSPGLAQADSFSQQMAGKILLQVEENGEGWYIDPDTQKRAYLGRPADAFQIMRDFGLGISHEQLQKYLDSQFPSDLGGEILLDVEKNGEAYYVDPGNSQGYFLGRPKDAFKVMREQGMGISNQDLDEIPVHEKYKGIEKKEDKQSEEPREKQSKVIAITSGPSGTIDYNDVTFEWAVSDKAADASNLLYSYILEGKDDRWSNWTKDTNKVYTNLNNGSYIFKVKARGEGQDIDFTPATSSFKLQLSKVGLSKWVFSSIANPSSPALGSNGIIYVSGRSDGKLYAINPDGSKSWSFNVGGGVGMPTIGPSGMIYVMCADGLYAINPDGSKSWSFNLGDVSHTPYHSSIPAIGSDGTIYVGSENEHLYAINPNGTEKWSFKIESDGAVSSPAISSDETIYIGSDSSNFYAINPDGTEKWSFTSSGCSFRADPAIGSDGTIYVGCTGGLYAINPDGTEKWSFNIGYLTFTSPVVGSDGTIYIGFRNNNLYAINPDGNEKWVFETSGKIDSAPAIDSNGTIYVSPNYDNNFYAINPNGTEKWIFEAENKIDSSPAIGPDGTIYVGSYAIYGESDGLADSPWPMFQNNLGHTGRKNK